METVRSIRIVLDSEVNSITAGLQVLALSQALQRGDLNNFRTDAEAFVSLYAEESALVLADRDGRQFINTRAPAGTALPPRQNRAGTEAVFRTARPFYSRVFFGSVSRMPIITIDVPVMRDGEVAYVLSFNPP
ncbi:MAG TPA: sensor histidine kinase, partial [Xanthobacteraceae bacterium]|nr:sensor histidine kinase [Xanthobacteraceae bacterium]